MAANPVRGEKTFDVDGKTYRMAFSTNSIIELEEELDDTMVNITERLTDPKGVRMSLARSVFRAALLEYQPDITHQDAGRLMDKLGPIRSLELVAEAMTLSFPEADANDPLEGKRRGKRIGSTGRRS